MTTITNYHRNIRTDIIKGLVHKLENLEVHEVNPGDIRQNASLVMSRFYAQRKITDFQIDVGFKNPDKQSEGYELLIEIEYQTGALDDFVLFVDIGGQLGEVPVDPIAAYDRAMGIL